MKAACAGEVGKDSGLTVGIAAAVQEQSSSLSQLNLDQAPLQSAATAEQAAAAGHPLASEAGSLADLFG